MANHKVLIVDESSATRTRLRELLPKGNYEIREADDGDTGLHLIERERENIRFILLGAELGQPSAWNLLNRIQADRDLYDVPMVLMTADKPATLAQLNAPPVACELLEMPFEKRQLQKAIKAAIAKAKAAPPAPPAAPDPEPEPEPERSPVRDTYTPPSGIVSGPASIDVEDWEDATAIADATVALEPVVEPEPPAAARPDEAGTEELAALAQAALAAEDDAATVDSSEDFLLTPSGLPAFASSEELADLPISREIPLEEIDRQLAELGMPSGILETDYDSDETIAHLDSLDRSLQAAEPVAADEAEPAIAMPPPAEPEPEPDEAEPAIAMPPPVEPEPEPELEPELEPEPEFLAEPSEAASDDGADLEVPAELTAEAEQLWQAARSLQEDWQGPDTDATLSDLDRPASAETDPGVARDQHGVAADSDEYSFDFDNFDSEDSDAAAELPAPAATPASGGTWSELAAMADEAVLPSEPAIAAESAAETGDRDPLATLSQADEPPLAPDTADPFATIEQPEPDPTAEPDAVTDIPTASTAELAANWFGDEELARPEPPPPTADLADWPDWNEASLWNLPEDADDTAEALAPDAGPELEPEAGPDAEAAADALPDSDPADDFEAAPAPEMRAESPAADPDAADYFADFPDFDETSTAAPETEADATDAWADFPDLDDFAPDPADSEPAADAAELPNPELADDLETTDLETTDALNLDSESQPVTADTSDDFPDYPDLDDATVATPTAAASPSAELTDYPDLNDATGTTPEAAAELPDDWASYPDLDDFAAEPAAPDIQPEVEQEARPEAGPEGAAELDDQPLEDALASDDFFAMPAAEEEEEWTADFAIADATPAEPSTTFADDAAEDDDDPFAMPPDLDWSSVAAAAPATDLDSSPTTEPEPETATPADESDAAAWDFDDPFASDVPDALLPTPEEISDPFADLASQEDALAPPDFDEVESNTAGLAEGDFEAFAAPPSASDTDVGGGELADDPFADPFSDLDFAAAPETERELAGAGEPFAEFDPAAEPPLALAAEAGDPLAEDDPFTEFDPVPASEAADDPFADPFSDLDLAAAPETERELADAGDGDPFTEFDPAAATPLALDADAGDPFAEFDPAAESPSVLAADATAPEESLEAIAPPTEPDSEFADAGDGEDWDEAFDDPFAELDSASLSEAEAADATAPFAALDEAADTGEAEEWSAFGSFDPATDEVLATPSPAEGDRETVTSETAPPAMPMPSTADLAYQFDPDELADEVEDDDDGDHTVIEDRRAVEEEHTQIEMPAAPPPTAEPELPEGMVTLGGFDDVLMRFHSSIEEERLSALRDAPKCGQPGFELLLQAYKEEIGAVQQAAERLLLERLQGTPLQYNTPDTNRWLQMECLYVLRGHAHWVQDVAIAPDGRTLVSGSKDSTLKLWDLLTGRETATLRGHTSSVLSVRLNPDGTQIISSSRDNTIRIWDRETGNELRAIEGNRGHPIYVLAISPDGQKIISASADSNVKPKFDFSLDALLSRLPAQTSSPVVSALKLLCRTQAIRVWNLASGKPEGTLVGYSRGLTDLCVSPDGELAIAGSRDQTIQIWEFKTGNLHSTLLGHVDEIRSLALSPDGRSLVSGSRDRTIKVWDLRTGHVLRTLRGHAQSVTSVAISPDGQVIVSGSRDGTVRLWDFHTGRHLHTLLGHADLVRAIAISPDGQTIVSGSRDNTVRVWRSVQ